MSKLKIWDALKTPPQSALRKIGFGYLKGKSDIDPMWRCEAMTKQFGPCGIGWRFTIDRLWSEAGASGELMCFANVSVFVKEADAWSEAIPGNGGNMLINTAKGALKTSDEGYKMAITDALGTAMKMLGLAADVYMGKFETKYNDDYQKKNQGGTTTQAPAADTSNELAKIKQDTTAAINSAGFSQDQIKGFLVAESSTGAKSPADLKSVGQWKWLLMSVKKGEVDTWIVSQTPPDGDNFDPNDDVPF